VLRVHEDESEAGVGDERNVKEYGETGGKSENEVEKLNGTAGTIIVYS
jgi:hypothetical protein